MLLYLSSSVYIFAILEISLPYFSVVGIYRGETVWKYKITDNKDFTNIPPGSSGVVVWILNSYYS